MYLIKSHSVSFHFQTIVSVFFLFIRIFVRLYEFNYFKWLLVNNYVINNVYWVQFCKHFNNTCFTSEETEVLVVLPQSHSLGFEAQHDDVSVLDRRALLSLWKLEEIIGLVPETLKLASPSNAVNSYLVPRVLAIEMEADPLG